MLPEYNSWNVETKRNKFTYRSWIISSLGSSCFYKCLDCCFQHSVSIFNFKIFDWLSEIDSEFPIVINICKYFIIFPLFSAWHFCTSPNHVELQTWCYPDLHTALCTVMSITRSEKLIVAVDWLPGVVSAVLLCRSGIKVLMVLVFSDLRFPTDLSQCFGPYWHCCVNYDSLN